MLKAVFIVPATSEWSSTVVISTKKDRHPRFCVDYHVLNLLIKGDRWLIPKIEEIFDDVIGVRFFTTMDFFLV